MFCSNCGRNNDQGSVYCDHCGAILNSVTDNRQGVPYTASYTPPGTYSPGAQFAPPYAPQTPPMMQTPFAPPDQPIAVKRKRTGLIVGLVLGAAALIAVIVLIVSLTGTSAVIGTWYCEERGIVLEFQKDSIVLSHTAEGDDEGNYTFNNRSNKGFITADESEFEFLLEDRQIVIDDIGKFRKAGSSFDADEFLGSNGD